MMRHHLAAFTIVQGALGLALAATGAAGPGGAGAPRVSSIVPPPPQVVEELRARGQALPPLHELTGLPARPRPELRQANLNLLAVLVDFSDNGATVTTATAFDTLVFAPQVVGRGSVRDFFVDTSYGKFDVTTVNLPSTLGWQRATLTYASYVAGQYGMFGAWPGNAGAMVLDVLALVDPVVDFSQYDNDGDGSVDTLLVIHSGTGAEFSTNVNHMWSHASSITAMGGTPPTLDGVVVDRYVTVPELLDPALASAAVTDMTVGVICHEVAHGLWGLPDLYDLDNSSAGIGQWGLMSFGDWNGPAKWNPYLGFFVTDGSSPALPNAWSRAVMGFDTPVTVTNPQQLCLLPAEGLPGGIVRLESALLAPREYFLLENRQAMTGGYDQFIPGSGLLIWHVDEARWSRNGGTDNNQECRSLPNAHCWGSCATTHYLVALEQADGGDHLEYNVNRGDGGDPFPGTSANPAFQPWTIMPVNPESGTWYDSSCAIDTAIDLSGIFINPPPTLTACVTVQNAGVPIAVFADGFESGDTTGWSGAVSR